MHRSSHSIASGRASRDQAASASLLGNRANSARQSELNAAFDSDDEDQGGEVVSFDGVNSGNSSQTSNQASSGQRDRLPDYNQHHRSGNESEIGEDLFFDAGDAMPSHDVVVDHPLSRTGLSDDDLHNSRSNENRSSQGPFPDATSLGSAASVPSSAYHQAASDHPRDSTEIDQEELSFLDAPSSSSSNGRRRSNLNHTNLTSNSPQDNLSKVRFLLGRFGRFVGMRVPGATYSTLSQEDNENNNNQAGGSGAGAGGRRRVMGGGIGQDGVFANLNAKPERRRRVRDGAEDRGEDDDLVSSEPFPHRIVDGQALAAVRAEIRQRRTWVSVATRWVRRSIRAPDQASASLILSVQCSHSAETGWS